MTKNPLINALTGLLYITGIASLIYFTPDIEHQMGGLVAPIAFLSLFVFSACTMAFLFLYQPAMLFMENKRKEAVTLFLTTIASFAGITLTLVVAWTLLISLG